MGSTVWILLKIGGGVVFFQEGSLAVGFGFEGRQGWSDRCLALSRCVHQAAVAPVELDEALTDLILEGQGPPRRPESGPCD